MPHHSSGAYDKFHHPVLLLNLWSQAKFEKGIAEFIIAAFKLIAPTNLRNFQLIFWNLLHQSATSISLPQLSPPSITASIDKMNFFLDIRSLIKLG